MEQGGTALKERTAEGTRTKEPPMYKVFVLNDDDTYFDFVIKLMQSVFSKSYDEAVTIAFTTHNTGMGYISTYTYDIAMSKVQKATKMAREQGFPLRFKISESE